MNNLNKYINKLRNHKLEDHQKKELRLLLRDFTIRLIQLEFNSFYLHSQFRRSQFCEVLVKSPSKSLRIKHIVFSAGTTKTSVYKVINSLKRAGVDINEKGILNIEGKSSTLYSKNII